MQNSICTGRRFLSRKVTALNKDENIGFWLDYGQIENKI